MQKKLDKLFCDVLEYEDMLVEAEPVITRRFANIDIRINDKVEMREKYKKWYPSFSERQIDILMQQYFYVIGHESTNDSTPVKEKLPKHVRSIK